MIKNSKINLTFLRKINFLTLFFLSIFISSESMMEYEIEHESISRSYLKYIPIDLNLKNEVDLFIGLHGYTGTATDLKNKPLVGLMMLQININF